MRTLSAGEDKSVLYIDPPGARFALILGTEESSPNKTDKYCSSSEALLLHDLQLGTALRFGGNGLSNNTFGGT